MKPKLTPPLPHLSSLSNSIERERVSKQAEFSSKAHIAYFFLQGLVIPYKEDLKPPTQYYEVSENETDFLRESWMRDKNFEADYIKDF